MNKSVEEKMWKRVINKSCKQTLWKKIVIKHQKAWIKSWDERVMKKSCEQRVVKNELWTKSCEQIDVSK